MGERIGVEQAIIFRGKTIEEVIEKYNKFNKDNENIEFVSFIVQSEFEKEVEQAADTMGRTTTTYYYQEPYGIYNYVEYVKDKLFGGGLG